MKDFDSEVSLRVASCLALLDEMFHPRPAAIDAEIAQLRAGGVGEHAIDSLYPLGVSDYLRGIRLLTGDDSLLQMLDTSRTLADLPQVYVRLSQEALATLAADDEAEDQGRLTMLVPSLKILLLLRTKKLSQLLESNRDWQRREDGAFMKTWLRDLEGFLAELRRRQLLSHEQDPLRRTLLRLHHASALLGLNGTRGFTGAARMRARLHR